MAHVTKELLSDWGKEAAANLINDSIPLNDTIMKIASENHLNADQVARAVEAANIAMHTSVYTNNKYPEFEVADMSKISSKLQETPKVASASDYDMSPRDLLYVMSTKQASYDSKEELPIDANLTHRIKKEFRDLANHYDDKCAELEQDVYEAAYELKRFIKQSALNPDETEASIDTFKLASYRATNEEWRIALDPIFEEIDNELKATTSMSLYKKASTAIPDKSIVLNEDHPYMSKLANYLDRLETYTAARINRDYNLTKLAKQSLQKLGTGGVSQTMSFGEAMGAPFRWITQSPTMRGKAFRLLAVGAPVAGAAALLGGASFKAGQKSILNQVSPMNKNNLSPRYQKDAK